MYESVPLLPEVFASLMALKLIKILGFFDSESATVHPVGVGRVCTLYSCACTCEHCVDTSPIDPSNV